MGLRKYIVRRALDSLVTAFFVFVLCFFLCYRRLEQSIGLTETEQFVEYTKIVFLEQFGRMTGASNTLDYVLQQLPYTLFLMLTAAGLAIAVGTLLGSIVSFKHGSKLDLSLTFLSVIMTIIPAWLLSTLLLSDLTPFFPAGKWFSIEWAATSFWQNPIGKLQNFLWHGFLPVLSLTIGLVGVYFIIAKGSMLSTLGEPYIITAEAKGVSRTRVVLKHALRNVIVPIAASSALAPVFLINSLICVEHVFSLDGVGMMLYRSVVQAGLWGEEPRRWPLPTLPAVFLLFSLSIIAIQFFLDVLNYGLDPRLRRSMTDGAGLDPTSKATPWKSKVRKIKALAKKLTKGASGKTGWTMLLLLTSLALLAPYLPIANPELQQSTTRNQPPSRVHFFGTDELGRDVLSRTIWAARHSLLEILGALAIAICLGTLIGTISGYLRDRPIAYLLDRLTDVLLSVPLVLVAIFFPIELGSLKWILAVGLSTWAPVAKIVRAQSLVTREKAYIESAKAVGASKTHIILRYVLPDVIGIVAANVLCVVSLVILIQTSLDFFGFKRFIFSTNPEIIPVKVAPVLTWGSMLSYSASSIIFLEAWWMAIFPMMCLVLLGTSLVLIGNRVAEIFSPQAQFTVRF